MLDPDPTTRVTMTGALSHKWMAPHVKYARSCFYKSATGSRKNMDICKSKGKTKINTNNKGKEPGVLRAAVAKSKINKSK